MAPGKFLEEDAVREEVVEGLVGPPAYAGPPGGGPRGPPADASVVRGGLSLAAVGFGRQNTAPIALALAAAAMTAADPQVVHDVGFQLSFSATLGLMTLAPRLAVQTPGVGGRWPGLDGFPPSP